MKMFTGILLVLFATSCFAVGWKEVSREKTGEFGIDVQIKKGESGRCHHISVKLPNELFFGNLGKRELWEVEYRKITTKDAGWQLMPKGTKIDLPLSQEGAHRQVVTVCLSDEDLEFGYLSAGYSGPPGTPPMVVLIDLRSYR